MTRGTAVREVERKYELPPGCDVPALSEVPGVGSETGPERVTLDAVYYDTADLRLLRHGVTLRCRRGGDDAGWHLKIPAGEDARTEIRLPSQDSVPRELAAMVRSYTRAEPLAPQARLHTDRTRRVLLDSGEIPLAEVVVDRVDATGPDGQPHRWSEVEVELAAGGPSLADAVEARLRDAGITRSASPAKVARVLGVPRRMAPELDRESTAGEVVLAYLREQAAVLAACDVAVRRDEPDAVHRMRVAARRARSTLRSYRTLLRNPPDALAGELGWLGVQLGAARDVEVQWARLVARLDEEREPADERVRARLDRFFADRAERARGVAIEALDSDRYLRLLDALDLVDTNAKAEHGAVKVIPKALAAVVSTVDTRVRAVDAAPPGADRDELVHRVRKAAKRLRYAAEAARPLNRSAAHAALARFIGLQDLLGEYQDAVVARAQLRELAADSGDGFVFGVLYQREREIADAQVARLDHAWRQAKRALKPLLVHES
ncbi:CYTH and CHAD domain-containing protein [Amycolatopsis sp. GM8]|uniref:CYTH and CHAD domain-containing protein n=1 Tax=Amycolatopsis sp. GM8 TaxID=2896530 RepID=UPI001F34174F|nr:CYTH and CHAD domain-containing protein [Amycolatopsis sp. GM8]